MSKYKIDSCNNKWWINDQNQYHREDGPAVEYPNGDKEWWINGKPHREDGPAVDHLFIKEWYINGKLHRDDGPALEYLDGRKYWFFHGKRISCSSNKEFLKIIKMKAFW